MLLIQSLTLGEFQFLIEKLIRQFDLFSIQKKEDWIDKYTVKVLCKPGKKVFYYTKSFIIELIT